MGRSYTPKYRIEVEHFGDMSPPGWTARSDLGKWIELLIVSQMEGGQNAHLAKDGNPIIPRWARVVRQSDRVVISEWKQPMFYVLPENPYRAPGTGDPYKKA